MFKTDAGGLTLSLKDVKLNVDGEATWLTHSSQINRSDKQLTICTYSLPRSDEYLPKILGKRKHLKENYNITLIVNSKFEDRATRLKSEFPYLKVILVDNVHAKIALYEPQTVWLSSENFGSNRTWFEFSIGIHDKTAYDFYQQQIDNFLKHWAQNLKTL